MNKKSITPRLGDTLPELLVYSKLTPSQTSSYHKHTFIEVFYVLSGKCIHKINDKEQEIVAGDAFWLFPDDIHGFIRPSEDFLHRDLLIDLTYFQKICALYSKDFYSFFECNIPRQIALDSTELHDLEKTSSSIIEPIFNKRDINACAITTEIINLFLKHTTITSNTLPQWLIMLAQQLANPQSFHEKLNDIIKNISYSQGYVCRMFKKYFNITLSDYFNKQKIYYAHTLIQSTDLSIEQICNLIGFSSLSYFYRLFGQYYPHSPASYRKKNASNSPLIDIEEHP